MLQTARPRFSTEKCPKKLTLNLNIFAWIFCIIIIAPTSTQTDSTTYSSTSTLEVTTVSTTTTDTTTSTTTATSNTTFTYNPDSCNNISLLPLENGICAFIDEARVRRIKIFFLSFSFLLLFL